MNTYILQKDTPCTKAGSEFIEQPDSNYFQNSQGAGYDRKTVENNPEWFKLKEEKEWVKNTEIPYEIALSLKVLLLNGYCVTKGDSCFGYDPIRKNFVPINAFGRFVKDIGEIVDRVNGLKEAYGIANLNKVILPMIVENRFTFVFADDFIQSILK